MQSANERILAAAWLKRFGTPLPLLGCEELVTQILREHGVEIPPPSTQKHAKTGKQSLRRS